MTPRNQNGDIPFHRRKRIDWKNVVVGVLATLAVASLTGAVKYLGQAWDGKENARDHAADMRAIADQNQRVLDLLCDSRPTARQCK